MIVNLKRVDITAAWLHSHPDCFTPDMDKYALEIASDLLLDVKVIKFNQDFLADIKCLETSPDNLLFWWKDIFIARYTNDYYIDGSGSFEFVNNNFWYDFDIKEDGKEIFVETACEGDMKISVKMKYHDWLVKKGFDKETINDFYNINVYPKP